MPILARPIAPILPKRIAMVPGVGLSGYIRANRGFGIIRGGRNRGLGQDGTDVFSPTTNPPGQGYQIPDVTPVQVSGPGFIWAGTVGNLLNQWTQIASNVIAPRNTIQTGPQGTSVNLAAGSQLPPGALLTPGLAGGSGLWIIGGLALVAILVMAGKRN